MNNVMYSPMQINIFISLYSIYLFYLFLDGLAIDAKQIYILYIAAPEKYL